MKPTGTDMGEPADARQIDRQAADWLAERDAGHWNELRETELEKWLALSTRHRVSFLRLEHAWSRADRLRIHRDAPWSAEDVAASVTTSWVPAESRRRVAYASLAWLGGAAAAVVAVLAISLMQLPMLGFNQDGEVYSTVVGERAMITLDDGSKVTLNTDTRIRSDVHGRIRHVWLDDGEAYFEVSHDSTRPFIISAGGQQVRVVGTKFSLRREGDVLQANVVEGKVQITSSSGAQALLGASDHARATSSALRVRYRSTEDMSSELSWIDGKINLDGMTIEKAAAEFNRYNSRKIKIVDEATGRVLIGGSFDVNNVDGFSYLLRKGFGLDVDYSQPDLILVGAARSGVKGKDKHS